MKNFNFFALLLFLTGTFLQAQTFQNTTPTTAADAVARLSGCGFGTQPGVNMSSITIPTVGIISDPSKITVNLAIDAAWLGDVTVDLVSPQGEAITLIRRLGANLNSSCGDSSTFSAANILGFNSANTTPINASAVAAAIPIPAGNYAPTYGNAPYPTHNPGNMSTFLTGKQLQGEWRLIIYDYGIGEICNIVSWQIIVATGALLKTSEAGVFGSVISLKQNPVEDYLLLQVPESFKTLNLEIHDASGKLVKKENLLRNSSDLKMDVRQLPSGMYLLTPIKDGVRSQPIKFIKK